MRPESPSASFATMSHALPIGVVIDIDLMPSRDVVATGVCLKINRCICVMADLNSSARKFDGYSVYRNREVSRWRLWTREELSRPRHKIVPPTLPENTLASMKTFYSALRKASTFGLVAFYTDGVEDGYFVGRVLSLDRATCEFRLINTDGEETRRKTVGISEITHFSFGSGYEKRLERMIGRRTEKPRIQRFTK